LGGAIAVGVVIALVAVLLVHSAAPAVPVATATVPSASPSATPAVDSYVSPSAAVLAAAPEARYNSVIAGLQSYENTTVPAASATVYRLAADTPIYADNRSTLVGRFSGANFLGDPTVIVPVKIVGAWALVLTPARNMLPSTHDNLASAQTAGWVRFSALVNPVVLTQRIEISVSHGTLTIEGFNGTASASFTVAVGTTATPSPSGVTGYLQARYLDPAQEQTVHPIQLTSMHSAVADNPYGGKDGGLIGVHFFSTTSGAISHGCIRVPVAAITAINLLPLGTSVTIVA